jgi:hypothetical protein
MPTEALIAHAEPLDVEPLKTESATVDAHGLTLTMTFNRPLLDREVRMYQELPALPLMLADTQNFAARMEASELVVRLFRFYVLGNIVLPDTPAAMDWLKTYIDGGLGGPLRWPGMIVSAVNLLTRWGYGPSDRGFVAKLAKPAAPVAITPP